MMNNSVFGQLKTSDIHILADTINISQNNRILEMGKEGDLSYFSFFCRCLPPYTSYLTFGYNHKKTSGEYLKELPKYKFVSWKELSDSLYNEGPIFLKKHNIYITERLPNNTFNTIKVWLVKIPPTINDYQIIRNN